VGKARTINEQGDFMLNSVTAKAVIDHALFLGADFAELFVEFR
jgi:TldD protein